MFVVVLRRSPAVREDSLGKLMNAAGFLNLFREADFGLIDFTGLVIVNHCHK